MKIHPVGAELFHAVRRTDRQTYMTKVIVAFRNFTNAPKKSQCFSVQFRPFFERSLLVGRFPGFANFYICYRAVNTLRLVYKNQPVIVV